MSVCFKRIIAFLIDWNIIMAAASFVIFFVILIASTLPSTSVISILLFIFLFFLILAPFVLFVLRDVVFKGHSLGKRIFKLKVYDKDTLQPANQKQLFLRNIFFFICQIDAIILLVTKSSLGDTVAKTIVLPEQELEAYKLQLNETSCTDAPIKKKKQLKQILTICAIIIACIIAFIGFIQIVLNISKNSEEYKVAYSYFIESETFKQLGADESEIRFNQHSIHSETSNGKTVSSAKLGFTVKHKTFTVICHKENNTWVVCKHCTNFE